MKTNDQLRDHRAKLIRIKKKRERYVEFIHSLQYLLNDLENPVTLEDMMLMDDIKQAVIVFITKNKYKETNKVFLKNMKYEFYDAIKKLSERHSDINSLPIILFMEDYYFNKKDVCEVRKVY